MGKKKTQFDYIRDAEEPWQPRVHRASRAEKAEVPQAASELVDVLLALPAAQWDTLPISAATRQALHEHARIKPGARVALKRQLGRIAGLLRGEDLDELQEALEAVARGRSEREAAIDTLVRWRTKLVEGDNAVLTAFVDAYPAADRQRVRQAVGTAKKAAGSASESRSQRALLDVLKDAAGL